MLLETYKANGLLFNQNFLEQTSKAGVQGYRGELVLVEGGIADAKGHAKPPEEVLRGAVLLTDDKIHLVVGALDDIASLETLVSKYGKDFADDMLAILYVVNISEAVQADIGEHRFVLIPLVQGVPWNETIDELGLEKSDFKGQSAADKIVTLRDEIASYKPKYPVVALDDVLASATDTVREGWGAV
ncbi:MAG: hypothetical protein KDI88_06445 [Gammaproteobacteria bacterium]|nr:hypothetical protein [Gammaproteobacteria bacterium]